MFFSIVLALFLATPISAHGAGGHHHHHHDHDGHDHSSHGHSHGGAAGGGDHKDWGSSIAWKPTLEEGIAESASTGKPLFVLIHKSWCGACKALRPKFAASSEIAAEATNLVMVNLIDDEEPKDDLYKPGGAAYIPRIMFFRPNGKIMEVTSGNDRYKYFYGEPGAIVGAMKKAVALVGSEKYVNGEYEKGGDL